MRSKEKEIKITRRDESIPLDSAIYLKDLSFGYLSHSTPSDNSDHYNVKHVHLDIKKGQSVAIIGHNGSGKSTLAKLIDGILIQDTGEIYIFGVKMTNENALILRKDIALVFQNPDSQFIGATVRDDIAFGLENKCIDPKIMPEIISHCAAKVGMTEYLDAEPCNLSGGQKQRVAIAGAIARDCSILILDEAGAMLDPKGKHEIRDIIKETRKNNPDLTVLNITHELEDAYDSDRVIVMNKGEIVMDDTPDVVFSKDDELRAMHLDIPFAHKLARYLREDGYAIKDVKNDEELLDLLCQ